MLVSIRQSVSVSLIKIEVDRKSDTVTISSNHT